MKRPQIILFIMIGVFWFAFLLQNDVEGNKKQDRFIESVFARKVISVAYQNKSNRIVFNDGAELSFSTAMGKHYGKNFDEFIFPGDSIIKKSGRNSLIVQPKNGEDFLVLL